MRTLRQVLAILLCSLQVHGAIIYVRSTDGSDSDNGSTWALAKATICGASGALSIAAAGDTIYVSQSHAASTAGAVTCAAPTTASNPVKIICANDGAEPPTTNCSGVPATPAASEVTTGANILAFTGFAYTRGMKWAAGSGSSNAAINYISGSPWAWYHEDCNLQLANTSTAPRIVVGAAGGTQDDQLLSLNNCILTFGSTSQGIRVDQGNFIWKGTSSALGGATIPTAIFIAPSFGGGIVEIAGIDLSAAGSGKSLVTASGSQAGRYYIRNCKLGSSVGITTGTIAGPGGPQILLDNCDSTDTNYRMVHTKYQGTISNENTIVKSSGASDGTTSISHKFVTNSSGPTILQPLEGPRICAWNDSTGAKTATVEVVNDGSTLTDAQIWLELEYLGTSGFPIATFTSDRQSDPIFGSSANQASSSVTWTTTGLSSPVKQKLEVSFTANEKGPVCGRVMVAATSQTVYADPVLTIQ